MTVIELIKELQKYKQDLPVSLAYEQGTGDEVIRVFQNEDIDSNLRVYISEDEEE